ncbi:MAG: Gfo/Idh/MocA family oxidoreductase [Candidatus Omnitrophica bacterium]|nr:Gfo/Idh/MocA family oxidoreductase [Candidatus Omnitrophota bacterium]
MTSTVSRAAKRPERVTEGIEASRNETALVAVIGTGSAGMHHVEALRALGTVTPVAVPIRPERVEALGRAGYSTAAHVAEAYRMGARRCVIATDSGRHADDAMAAMDHGLDVLIEKPLALDARQARGVLERAAGTDRRAFVGCVLRFSESLQRFRQWLPDIGGVHAVRVACQSYLPEWRPARPYRESYSARADEGGVLRDLIHEIDLAGWMFGWPRRVSATVRNLGRLGIASEELAQLTWEAPGGALVSVTLDYLSRPSSRSITAYGQQGTLEWDGLAQRVTLMRGGAPARQSTSSQAREELFLSQAQAFMDACDGRTDARLATGEEGLNALAVCDAARRAEHSRREEPVEA